MISIVEPSSEHLLCNVCNMKATKELWFTNNIVNSGTVIHICNKCAHDLKIYLDNMELHSATKQFFYTPLCPRGYSDCVCDPAYIHFMHPDWYEAMYGDKSPEEVVRETCQKRVDEDTDGKFYCYDNEDK